MKLREYTANNGHVEDNFEGVEESSQSPSSLSLPALLNILKRKAWLIAGLTALAAAIGVAVTMSGKKVYTGNFYLLVEPVSSVAKFTNSSTIARGDGIPNESLYALDYPTNLAFLRSPGMSARIAQEIVKKDPTQSFPKVLTDLRENLIVNRLGDTSRTETKIFEVVYKGKEASQVENILKSTAQTFVRYSEEERRTSIKSGVSFIDKQLPGLNKILTDLQNKQQKIRGRQ